MPTSATPLIIRDFGGLNRRDGAERVLNNEFLKIQNFYQASKGIFYKRKGTSELIASSSFYGASAISAAIPHYSLTKKYQMFHCKPTSTPLADPTQDLVLTEINGGDLFNGGAVETMRFCYSWVGLGQESVYNSRNRAGYVSTAGTDAWNQVGHQSIVVSANTKGVRVTVPAFPSGVRSANVFAARGVNTQMVFVGCVTESAGTLDVVNYIGPGTDDVGTAMTAVSTDVAYGYVDASGTLDAGQYYVSFCWLESHSFQENGVLFAGGTFMGKRQFNEVAVNLLSVQNAIAVSATFANSVSGNTTLAVFIGRKPMAEHPHVFAGFVKSSGSLVIRSIKKNTNASTSPTPVFSSASFSYNYSAWTSNPIACPDRNDRRGGFIICRDEDGTTREVFTSRSENFHPGGVSTSSTIMRGDGMITTDVDTYELPSNTLTNQRYLIGSGLAIASARTGYSEPEHTYLSGLTYMVNGLNGIRTISEHSVGYLVERNRTGGAATWTARPPRANRILTFGGVLLVAGTDCGNQVYASNVSYPYDFGTASGPTTARFVTVGDAFESKVTALGIFSYNTGISGPESFWLAFKDSSCWAYSSFPDTSGGTSINNVSGTVGCFAPKTIVNSPIGTIFMGNDGDIFLMRGNGEPYRIGARIKPFLQHLSLNSLLMAKCVAVYHEDHLKISYPSTSSSTYNDAEIWADLRTEDGNRIQWSGPHVGPHIGPQIILKGQGSTSTRYAADSAAVRVLALDDSSTYQDLGVAMTSIVQSKILRYAAETHWKRLDSIHLDAYYDTSYSHDVKIEAFADDDYSTTDIHLSDGAYIWDGASYDSGLWGDAMYFPVPWFIGDTPLVGRTHQFQVTHSNNANFILAAVALHYRPEKRLYTAATG